MAQPVYRLRLSPYTVAIIYLLTKKVMTRFIQALVMISVVALFAGCGTDRDDTVTPVVDETLPVVEEPVTPTTDVVPTEEPAATTEVAE